MTEQTQDQARTIPVRVMAGDGPTTVWHSPAEFARLWAGVDREVVWALDGLNGERGS